MLPRAAATCVIAPVEELRTEPVACVMLPAAARRVMVRLEPMLPTVRLPAVAFRVTVPARVALPAAMVPPLVLTATPVRLMPPPPEEALPWVDRVEAAARVTLPVVFTVIAVELPPVAEIVPTVTLPRPVKLKLVLLDTVPERVPPIVLFCVIETDVRVTAPVLLKSALPATERVPTVAIAGKVL